MPSTCEFFLNHPNGVYYSGEVISGTIRLTTTSEKNVRNVRIRFLGEAKVHWEETESYTNSEGKRRTRTIYFRGQETYVDNSTYVYGEGVLQPGTYDWTFNIALPLSCPTSCEGRYGNIRYQLYLTLDRPYRFDNEFVKPVTVLRTVDLNYNPTHRIPLQVEDDKSVGCWPCHSGDMFFKLTIPQGGYAPGQTLKYTLHIENQSMSDIKGYEVNFIQNMAFTAHSPRVKTRYDESYLVTEEYDDECLRQMNRIFEGDLVLPSMAPSTEGHSIIHVDYLLKLTLCIEGCHTNKSVKAGIFIGTVPLMPIMPQASAMPMEQVNGPYMPVQPSAPTAPTNEKANGNDSPPMYSEAPPPSFAEALTTNDDHFVNPDANEHNNVIGFRPMYPVYPSAPEKQ